MEIPYWAKNKISPEDLPKIESAIARLESKSRVELVPMLVRSSVPQHVLLYLTAAKAGVVSFFAHLLFSLMGSHNIELQQLVLLFPISFFTFHGLLKWPAFYRKFLGKNLCQHYTKTRAEQEFYQSQIYETRRQTGMLLLFSLKEKQIYIKFDPAMDHSFSPEQWQEMMTEAIHKTRREGIGKAILHLIGRMYPVLLQEFPVAEDDTNELRDHLVIKD